MYWEDNQILHPVQLIVFSQSICGQMLAVIAHSRSHNVLKMVKYCLIMAQLKRTGHVAVITPEDMRSLQNRKMNAFVICHTKTAVVTKSTAHTTKYWHQVNHLLFIWIWRHKGMRYNITNQTNNIQPIVTSQHI